MGRDGGPGSYLRPVRVYVRGVRWIVGIVGGTAAAVATYAVIVAALLVLGGTECDKGQCNAVGAFGANHSSVLFAAAVALSLAAGAIVGGRIVRRQRRATRRARA
ncbi:MAG: hypothetical protein QOE17_243 [Gaiellales bacterium]|nr:hypothetical protein [Gaiellales bacterium]